MGAWAGNSTSPPACHGLSRGRRVPAVGSNPTASASPPPPRRIKGGPAAPPNPKLFYPSPSLSSHPTAAPGERDGDGVVGAARARGGGGAAELCSPECGRGRRAALSSTARRCPKAPAGRAPDLQRRRRRSSDLASGRPPRLHGARVGSASAGAGGPRGCSGPSPGRALAVSDGHGGP
ncbi:hypothetical protein PVAP13_2KG072416 [Panicum virgatum]|uniref:Uncharacterized protein n=1 Tax=Panicum virgatum TaxID=38727 RepID=A0A8T0WAB0_PANVG|nr:hypothetical protein PVAP13_2KG072416 [Panicum virgatum]